jgi:hypothetical protein
LDKCIANSIFVKTFAVNKYIPKAFALSFIVLSILLSFSSSCKKETTVKEIYHDTTVVFKHDSIITRYDVLKWMTKKWTLTNHELESYSGNLLVSKKQENFNGLGYYMEFKSGGSTVFFDLGGSTTGTWQLLSDNYYVLDRNTTGERYYYILSISETNLVVHGPFNRANGLYSTGLVTAYYTNP